jgi:hypothetical protein
VASVIDEFSGEIEAFASDVEKRISEGIAAEVAKAQPELVALREAVGNFQADLAKAREEGRIEGERKGAGDMLAALKSRLGHF